MVLGDGMARAYSSDLRMRVIRAVEGGFSARGAGRRLGIGELTATAWMGRWRRTGSAAAKSQKGRSRSPLQPHPDWLLALIGERADLTLEIRRLRGERGLRVGVSSAVLDQVMRQEPAEQAGAFACAIRQDARHQASVVVVKHRQRHSAKESKSMNVAVDPSLCRCRWIGPM